MKHSMVRSIFNSKKLHSLDVENEAFQVFALRMIDINRMVGRLVQLVEDAHRAACLGGRREDGIAEMVLGYYLRAGEREQDATRSYFVKCFCVQTSIAF